MRPFKRRRKLKTDYRKRIAMLKSGKPRLVVRRYNNTIVIQLVEFSPTGDKTVFTVSSKKLRDYGWEFHTGNVPAAYLTGILAGKIAKEKGYETAILDAGLQRITKSNAIMAAAKGFRDSGIELPMDESMVDESRLRGEHIKSFTGKDIPGKVDEIKKKIMGD